MREIVKVNDAVEVGGFLIPTKQLQNTLKFLSLIGSRLKHQLRHIQGLLPPVARETMPCRLRHMVAVRMPPWGSRFVFTTLTSDLTTHFHKR